MVININEQPKDDHLIFPTKWRADEQEGEGVEQKSEMIGFYFLFILQGAPLLVINGLVRLWGLYKWPKIHG